MFRIVSGYVTHNFFLVVGSIEFSYIDVACSAFLLVQAVGYNSVEAEDWKMATRGEDIGKLETLLLDKNRKMEHELTQVKVRP